MREREGDSGPGRMKENSVSKENPARGDRWGTSCEGVGDAKQSKAKQEEPGGLWRGAGPFVYLLFVSSIRAGPASRLSLVALRKC